VNHHQSHCEKMHLVSIKRRRHTPREWNEKLAAPVIFHVVFRRLVKFLYCNPAGWVFALQKPEVRVAVRVK